MRSTFFSALPLALAVLSWGNALTSPSLFAVLRERLVADVGGGLVGASASVATNPYNTLAQELEERASAVRDEEARLTYARAEMELEAARNAAGYRARVLWLALGELVVVALIALHLRLDHRLWSGVRQDHAPASV